ncbi:MAG: MGMT family protein [Clostridia bacterium]|nr:MGMT family protein [Clostridia bacterium]
MTVFTEHVVQIIKSIPIGRVMTYGQIAAEAGNPRAARQVARILHSMSAKYDLPWHRVVNRKGELPRIGGEKGHLQKQLLESEGVDVFVNYSVDLMRYGFNTDEGSVM